jgi:hypothetical protein
VKVDHRFLLLHQILTPCFEQHLVAQLEKLGVQQNMIVNGGIINFKMPNAKAV